MDFKKRNVRFYGLMTAVFLLFCISICGCITITINECCQGTRMNVEQGKVVQGPVYVLGRIKGYVRKSGTNEPITNATITYSGAGGSGNTNSTPAPMPGYYQTAQITCGYTYNMTVTAPGYQQAQASVQLICVSPTNATTKDFYLTQ